MEICQQLMQLRWSYCPLDKELKVVKELATSRETIAFLAASGTAFAVINDIKYPEVRRSRPDLQASDIKSSRRRSD